jgi:hypothetical protein
MTPDPYDGYDYDLMLSREQLIEKLAALEHEQWVTWSGAIAETEAKD